jgi:hypothetical protein
MESKPYCLDIDLDSFHTHKALKPSDSSVFYRLIRNATAITIAVESECTMANWIDDGEASVSQMLEAVYTHIAVALNGGHVRKRTIKHANAS